MAQNTSQTFATRVTSLSNDRVKNIRKLRERKERQATGLFFVEGLRIVGEAVQQGAHVELLIVAPDLLRSDFGHQLVAEQCRLGVEVLEVSKPVFESLALKEGPQGIAAVVRQRWKMLNSLSLGEGDLWVALDSIQDPGNLGTVMRTLDSVGGKGIILLDNTTDPYDPTALRASMGAVFSLDLVRSSFDDFASWKTKNHLTLVGTSGSAHMDYHYFGYPPCLILLMGSERQGLQTHHLRLCDAVVRIPMVGRSDSLNLAVSTAVVLYEIFNQRRERQTGEVRV
ncbi:MAG: RNA methyltransferase [Anaerolineae bacterium]|nr:RNA methyltransferase [Anaerolineae bacterium]